MAQYGAHGDEIDLVLLDYSLPGTTGLQVFEDLRKLDPEVCVVFASGYALEGDASPLLAAGRAFVAKPYRPAELMEAVRKALDETRTPRCHSPTTSSSRLTATTSAAHDQHALAVSLNPGEAGLGDIEFARRVGVAQIV